MSYDKPYKIEALIIRSVSLINNLREKGVKFFDKFGYDKKFARIYGTFLRDVLKLTQTGLMFSDRTYYTVDRSSIANEFTQYDGVDPIMIISG